ncbi:response regulator [Nitrosopumilus sp.]|uniref:response regulator n=1 Tax=Nitrosopumilus sp. TaxID=2024843 RepID=UPI0026051B00|nr:response regulator [Nitrosopumilus sp.]
MTKDKVKQKEELQSLNILIIDDNEQITKMLTTFLELKDHKCTVANDGREGLKIIKENHHDVILLDLAMPEFDGYSVIKDLEENNSLKDHKIIVFTASTITQEELDDLVKQGVTGYILKPIDIDILHSKLIDTAEL